MIKTLTMAEREIAAGVATGDIPHINSSNALVGTCSALKLFFAPQGLTNLGTINARLASAVGDVIVNIGSDCTLVNNLITPTTGIKALTAGSIAAIGATDDILLVASGQQSASNLFRFDVCDSADGVTALSMASLRNNVAGAGQCIITDSAAATVSLTALSAATAAVDQHYFVAFDRSGNGKAHRDMGTIATTATQTTAIAAVNGALTFASASPGIFMFGKYYAAAMFVFPAGTLPSNWEGLSSWMCKNWAAGNFVVPRGW